MNSCIEYTFTKSNIDQDICKVDDSHTLEEAQFDSNIEVNIPQINVCVKYKDKEDSTYHTEVNIYDNEQTMIKENNDIKWFGEIL